MNTVTTAVVDYTATATDATNLSLTVPVKWPAPFSDINYGVMFVVEDLSGDTLGNANIPTYIAYQAHNVTREGFDAVLSVFGLQSTFAAGWKLRIRAVGTKHSAKVINHVITQHELNVFTVYETVNWSSPFADTDYIGAALVNGKLDSNPAVNGLVTAGMNSLWNSSPSQMTFGFALTSADYSVGDVVPIHVFALAGKGK